MHTDHIMGNAEHKNVMQMERRLNKSDMDDIENFKSINTFYQFITLIHTYSLFAVVVLIAFF